MTNSELDLITELPKYDEHNWIHSVEAGFKCLASGAHVRDIYIWFKGKEQGQRRVHASSTQDEPDPVLALIQKE
jgi:hypothetical protein